MNPILDIAKRISSDFYPLSDQGLKLLASIIETKELSKGEIYLSEGETDKYIAYVEKGLMRQFYYKNGRDITEHFTVEGKIIFCTHSLFHQVATQLMAEALEPSILYRMPYKKLLELGDTYPEILHFVRKMLEFCLVLSQEKADSWRFETARERYERFFKDFPEAAKRASVNHIASYLLMTPESLSRVRAGLL